MGYRIFPLSEFIRTYPEEDIQKRLSLFRCSRDTDLEDFLHRLALPYEKRDLARVYLALDSESGSILGYFSLSMRCGIVPHGRCDVPHPRGQRDHWMPGGPHRLQAGRMLDHCVFPKCNFESKAGPNRSHREQGATVTVIARSKAFLGVPFREDQTPETPDLISSGHPCKIQIYDCMISNPWHAEEMPTTATGSTGSSP